LPELLHCRFVLYVDNDGGNMLARAIALIAKPVGDEIKDDSFLGVVGCGNGGRSGLGKGKNAEEERRNENPVRRHRRAVKRSLHSLFMILGVLLDCRYGALRSGQRMVWIRTPTFNGFHALSAV
jgi:hypothetical protein